MGGEILRMTANINGIFIESFLNLIWLFDYLRHIFMSNFKKLLIQIESKNKLFLIDIADIAPYRIYS